MDKSQNYYIDTTNLKYPHLGFPDKKQNSSEEKKCYSFDSKRNSTICQNRGWNKKNTSQSIFWIQRIKNFEKQIYKKLYYTDIKSKFLTILVILFSTMSCALSFFNVGVNSKDQNFSSYWISIVIGTISLFAAVISSLKNSLGYDIESQNLKKASVKFSKLVRKIETVLNSQCEYKPFATPWLSFMNEKFAKYHSIVSFLREKRYDEEKINKDPTITMYKRWNSLPDNLTFIKFDEDEEIIFHKEETNNKKREKKKKKNKSKSRSLTLTTINDNKEIEDCVINVKELEKK